jgi:hypothetical protein
MARSHWAATETAMALYHHSMTRSDKLIVVRFLREERLWPLLMAIVKIRWF